MYTSIAIRQVPSALLHDSDLAAAAAATAAGRLVALRRGGGVGAVEELAVLLPHLAVPCLSLGTR